MTGSQDDRGREPVPDLQSLLRLIDRSAHRDQLADAQSRRRLVFEALANHADPMWREIGEQLRDGRMGIRDVLRVQAYWDKVQQGLAEHGDEFRRAMIDAKEQLEREEAERRERER
ncbi:MAG: hypothetical protein FWJ70_14150 [Micromonosporaceae bacterium]